MIIYFAGHTVGIESREGRIIRLGEHRLYSYYYSVFDRSGAQCFNYCLDMKKNLPKDSTQKIKMFLDSGAYSAKTQGVPIDLETYVKYIKEVAPYLEIYASLDVIGDAEATLENQKKMEDLGVTPMPCFHRGEPFSYLEQYVDKYEYLALGGMVTSTNRASMPGWLDTVFDKYVCDKDGLPRVKIHGFGMTTFRLMKRYPWYSVDSTSWLSGSKRGTVYVPHYRNGIWDYSRTARDLVISNRSGARSVEGAHFDNFNLKEQGILLDYFKEKGFLLGKSSFKKEAKGYELKEDEVWLTRPSDTMIGEVEIVEERGLRNDYNERDLLNITYYKDFEKTFPEYPSRLDRRNLNQGFIL